MMNSIANEYGSILDDYLLRKLRADELQEQYLTKFKNETRHLDRALYEILETVFGDVDSFTANVKLLQEKPDYYLDEDGLRERVRHAAMRLKQFK